MSNKKKNLPKAENPSNDFRRKAYNKSIKYI